MLYILYYYEVMNLKPGCLCVATSTKKTKFFIYLWIKAIFGGSSCYSETNQLICIGLNCFLCVSCFRTDTSFYH